MRSNPFATRFTRPGALPFLFPPGQSPETVVAALRQAGWWGQIVGPHGSGKSTLLAALMPALESQGRVVVHEVLRGQGSGVRGQEAGIRSQKSGVKGQFSLKSESWTNQTQVVIDGYEQLSWWRRRRVQSLCRRAGAGLLVTTHQSRGLTTLFQTEPSLPLAQSIVQQLLAPGDTTVTQEDVATAWQLHEHNLRELLFRLYDLYQSRRSC